MKAVAAVVLLLALLAAPSADAGSAPVNTTPPSISGTARTGGLLTADPGAWSPQDATFTYQWLRDGTPLAGASSTTYRPVAADVRHRLSVAVTATGSDGSADTATSAPTAPVGLGMLTMKVPPQIRGVPRFTHVLTAAPGRVRPAAHAALTWTRDATVVGHHRRYAIAVADVGHRLRLAVRYTAPGYAPLTVATRSVLARHRVPVSHVFTYHVETRGRVVASVATFKRLAQATYDDPRGWRSAGYEFRQVSRGGDFTLVLAQASWLPRFSSGCSAEWSCRAGRYVVINQDRWLHASPAWNAAHRALREYRTMVVDHETGHWLGHGHLTCPGPGRLAPVMMQQSKGLHGCRFNPWPLPSERWTSR